MKKSLLIAAGAAALATAARPAAADVSWEHQVSVRSSEVKHPVLRLKVFNNWTEQRHRMLLKYSVLADSSLPFPKRPFHMTALVPGAAVTNVGLDFGAATAAATPVAAKEKVYYHSGGLASIELLDDDRIIGYSSDMHAFYSEPRRAILKQMRFDPWQKLAPKYSKEAPPAFSTEQRKRLGGEIREITKPYLKDVWKGYFRALPNSRTFHGITSEPIVGKGYRMTWLINGGGMFEDEAQWMRMTFEWWIAPEMDGDDTVRKYQNSLFDSYREIGLPSASLWLNETYPVLWYTLPEVIHQAVETLVPPEGTPRAGLSGTPIYMAMTIKLPPAIGAELGDLRFETMLQKRHTQPLAASVFSAPVGYEKIPLQPKIKEYNDMLNQQIARRDRVAEEGMDDLGFSWKAMNAYTAATRDALPAGMRGPLR